MLQCQTHYNEKAEVDLDDAPLVWYPHKHRWTCDRLKGDTIVIIVFQAKVGIDVTFTLKGGRGS